MVTALQHTAPRAAWAATAAAAAPGPLAPPLSRVQLQQRQLAPVQQRQQQQRRQVKQRAAVVASAAAVPTKAAGSEGHTALLHGLGEVGEVAPVHMPWLLRLAHIKSRITGGDSNAALQESARGLLMWKVRAAGCFGGLRGVWGGENTPGQGFCFTPATSRCSTVADPLGCRRRWSGAWCWTTSPSSS